ncbi:MAG: hypothetical protein WAX77_15675 [Methylococcaceae bacterium]
MTKNQMITIKLMGFNPQQIESFEAILSLSEQGLEHTWKIVDLDSADFFLFTQEQNKDDIAQPYERCLFYSRAKSTEDDHLLLVDSYGLPRLRSVVEVFNRIATKTLAQAVKPINEVDIQKQFFNPDGLLKRLLILTQDPLATKHPLQHSLPLSPQQPTIYTHVAKNIYYCSVDLEQLDCYISADTLLTHTLSKEELDNKIDGLSPKPLNNLIWYLGFKASQGNLLQGHSTQNIVCLNNWPDLSIASCRSYMKLIAFMSNNAVPLIEISSYTQICVHDIYNFYNACYLIGLIDKKNAIEIQLTVHKQHNLLNKINNRLKEFDN